MSDWRQEIGRFMDWPMKAFAQAMREQQAVDIVEGASDFTVRLEVPGVCAKDIDLRVTSEAISVQGELQRQESGEDERGVYHSERRYGRFARTIPLPAAVKADTARATIRHGVLEVRIEKQHPGREGHRVEIEGSDETEH